MVTCHTYKNFHSVFRQYSKHKSNISLLEWIFKLRFVVLSLLFPITACTINLNKMFMRDQIITKALCLYQVS